MKESYNAYDLKEVITQIESTQTSELTTCGPPESTEEELTEVSPSKMARCEEPLAEPMEGVVMLEAAGADEDEDDALEAACQERLACDLLLDFELPRERTRHRTHRARNATAPQPQTTTAAEHSSPASSSTSASISQSANSAPARTIAYPAVHSEPASTNNAKEQRARKHADRRTRKTPQAESVALHSILKPAHMVQYIS